MMPNNDNAEYRGRTEKRTSDGVSIDLSAAVTPNESLAAVRQSLDELDRGAPGIPYE
jgi:hypothetical protein